MRKQEGCWPWGGDTQRSFYFCLKVTMVFNGGAPLTVCNLSPLSCPTVNLLCLFRLIVSSSPTRSWLPLLLSSPRCLPLFLLSFTHSLTPSFAPVSPSPELKCMLELFLSWIMRINCRGQMEWVSRDNDWSDGTWAPPDCGVSELVIKRQGGGRWVLTVSFKHYECQKRQCQNGPVFSPALYFPAPSASPLDTSNSFVISLFIQAGKKNKKHQFIFRSRVHV